MIFDDEPTVVEETTDEPSDDTEASDAPEETEVA